MVSLLSTPILHYSVLIYSVLVSSPWLSPLNAPSPVLSPSRLQPPSCCRSGGVRCTPAWMERSVRCSPTSLAGPAVLGTKSKPPRWDEGMRVVCFMCVFVCVCLFVCLCVCVCVQYSPGVFIPGELQVSVTGKHLKEFLLVFLLSNSKSVCTVRSTPNSIYFDYDSNFNPSEFQMLFKNKGT